MTTQPKEAARLPTGNGNRPLWRNFNYLALVGGQGISSLGTYMTDLALPLLALAITHSAVQTGLIIALRGLVMNILSLLAGAMADRWNRKRLMIYCEFGNALVTGSIPLAYFVGHLTLVQFYLVATIQGALFVFYQMAESSALRHTIPRAQLASAAGQNEVINSASIMIAPLIGGVLYVVNPLLPFVLDTISFAVSAGSLLLIRVSFQDEATIASVRTNIWQDIKEGLGWLWRTSLVRLLALMTAGLLVPCAGYSLLMIILAHNMHASNQTVGYIFAAGGLGSIIGAVCAAPLHRWLGFARLIKWSAWVWALSWLVYIFAPNPFVLAVMNCTGYAIVPVFMVSQYSYRIAMIPDQLQGRVNSAFRLLATGTRPVGIALTGVLLQYMGPVPTILITFVPQIIVAIAATFSQVLRQAKPIEEL